jgi:hypothetical protein
MKQITWAKATWWFMLGLAISYCIVSTAIAGGITTHHYNGFDNGGPPSYLKYKIPGTDVPCCNASDCKLATKWSVDRKTGDYLIWIDEKKEYYRVEKRRIIYDNVADIHICYTLNGTKRGYQVRCVIIPQGTM